MIFKKIFVYFVSTILLVTVILGIVIFYFLGNYVIDQKTSMLFSAGERLSAMSVKMLTEGNGSFSSYFDPITELSAMNLSSDVLLVDVNGNILYNTGIMYKNSQIKIPDDLVEKIKSGIKCSKVSNIGGFADSSLIAAIPIKLNNTLIGGIYLITFLPEITKLREDVIKIYLIAGIVTLLFSLILIYIFAKRVSDPIKRLRLASKQLSLGKLDTRVQVYNQKDEIGQLAEEFNDMADSIEKAEYMRRSFISDVSHELRTPMTTITGFVQGILDDTIPEEKRNMYLEIVLDESRRLSKLVTDLLDISRLESEEVKLDLVRFNINELIRISIIGFENRLNEKEIVVNVVFENDEEMVLAERDSIKRVITNLLDNAVKFSDYNGTIDISTYKKGNRVLISVKNQGSGISKDEQKTIFERFYKLDKSRSQNKNGVGLGLYIVKRIINKHGEKIWINSEEGKYAEFIFTLKK